MNKEDINSKTAKLIVKYCVENFGLSKLYDYEIPSVLIIDSRPTMDGFQKKDIAYFNSNDNIITIFKPNIISFVDFIDTIIHEYTHYLQDLCEYSELEFIYDYYDHPMEIEATETASKHKWLCKKYVAGKLKR